MENRKFYRSFDSLQGLQIWDFLPINYKNSNFIIFMIFCVAILTDFANLQGVSVELIISSPLLIVFTAHVLFPSHHLNAYTAPNTPPSNPMAEPLPPELMTVKETAEYLRIPLPTVYYLVQRGQLPAVQIGGRWRIKRSLLDRDILRKEEEAGQPTVMVVDDDPMLQALFKQFLKKAGFGRLVVGSGAEAIAMAKKQKFDFVFLDLKLPDIPGDEVYTQLKEIYPDLPIVVITGYPDSEILSRILSLGPVTVIKKPIEYEQLNRAVKQLGHKGAEG
jgi:excisionase family DNA binding protein